MPEPAGGVLVTRPEPGASETAARVVALGLRAVVAPVMEIRLLPVRLDAIDLQAILLTSGNAVPALPASHRQVPLLAVGDMTAARARAAGFGRVASADGDARALAVLARRACDPAGAPLLLATGAGQGKRLAADLQRHGFQVMHRAVYSVEPAAALPGPACDAVAAGEITAALFFSADSARQCVRLMQAAQLHEAVRTIDALAIGQPAAVALQALPWRCIRVASRPTQDAMLALLR